MKRNLLALVLLLFTALSGVFAQGVTTSNLTGKVVDPQGSGIPGANVVATHTPSGTTYGSVSQVDGKFNIPAMRIGGPYMVRISFVGYQESVVNDIFLSLGSSANLSVKLSEQATELETLIVSANRNDIFSSERTGAATNITKESINTLPTINRSINDFTRLTPQASGRSFGGADARFNNITIDGSIFNNSFGLSDQPGGRTGSTPISLDAIEEIQVNIAPYDVRQAGFVGAGVNAVTRSGTNEFTGSVFYNFRNQSLVGDEADGEEVTTTNFNINQYGFRVGGPIIKNKLFFFANGEIERQSTPATQFTANSGTETVGGTKTRVLRSDLDDLRSFLLNTYGYETGPYEGYNNETSSNKFLLKFDYNINENHKASLRFNTLTSETDVLASNSSSLGFGGRRTNTQALNYQNTNYIQKENIFSVIGEVNSRFGNNISNNLIVGYTEQVEDRGSRGDFFPLVEIQNAGTTYISFGFEPFTPNNQLSYNTFQFQNNLTIFKGNHTFTAGINFEQFSFENVFFPGSQSVYVYNSLQDFYDDTDTDPNNNPALRRFQLRYVNPNLIEPGSDPVQPTKVNYAGVYIQDEFSPIPNLKLTAGLRLDRPQFAKTGFFNPGVEPLSFVDQNGNSQSVNTAKLPDSNILFSPRLGFNYDVTGDRKTQIRGGTGIFTGRPVFVWISNQIGNNGVLTGFDQFDDVPSNPNDPVLDFRPFNPDPGAYIPATANLPATFELALTDPDFRFPQVLRTNIAIDQKLPLDLVGTVEYIYSSDVNGMGYYNANLPAPTTSFTGADGRPRYTSNRINSNISNAVTLTNSDKGYNQTFTVKLERPFKNGFTALTAYNFGVSKNTVNPGSIAAGTWFNNPVSFNPNDPTVGFTNNDQRHRFIFATSYRKEYGGEFGGATQIGLFWEGRNQGRTSYIYSTDLNGDGGVNDLIYIPRNQGEMNFQDYDPDGSGPAGIYAAAEQAADWEAYIQQDKYLSENRGSVVERNGVIFPWVWRADLSLLQEFYVKTGTSGKRNTIQVRFDIINVGNLLNDKWGVGSVINSNRPLRAVGVDANGAALHRLNTLGVSSTGTINKLTETFRKDTSINDVWQGQISLRYIFN